MSSLMSRHLSWLYEGWMCPLEMGNTGGGGAGFQEDEEFHSWSVSGRVAYLLDEQLKIC